VNEDIRFRPGGGTGRFQSLGDFNPGKIEQYPTSDGFAQFVLDSDSYCGHSE
jgi:hypothetical protein